MAKRINESEFDELVLNNKKLVIVDFYSDSCIPCKQLSPILGGIEDDYEDQLDIFKVNVNYEAELTEAYSVMASPTLIFFKEGKEVDRTRGLVKKPELIEKVKAYL